MSSKAELNQKTPCILEIGDKGIKMIDKSKPGVILNAMFSDSSLSISLFCQDGGGGVPSHEYFFSLKNVTFCGFHPRDHRYFGFITKVSGHFKQRIFPVLRKIFSAPGPLHTEVRLPCVCQRVLHEMCCSGLRVGWVLRVFFNNF